MTAQRWRVEVASGPAAPLFLETAQALERANAAPLSIEPERFVRALTVTEPTIVLGSSQNANDVVVDATVGLPIVVRRRSGGGAVWLAGESIVWLDIIVRRNDSLWSDDTAASMWWVGEAIAAVARAQGCGGAVVHRGSMVHHELDRKVCWTGIGPGEVSDGFGGAKIAGISQRRVRNAALFQIGVLTEPSQFLLAAPMSLDPAAILVCERSIAADREGLTTLLLEELVAIP